MVSDSMPEDSGPSEERVAIEARGIIKTFGHGPNATHALDFVTHDQEEALTMSDRIAVMSAGRILQIGSPTDDRPTERFVADFVGETNFLNGTVQDVQNGIAWVTFGSARGITATTADGFHPVSDATIMIRPEHARAVKAGGHLSGIFENVVYFGTDTHIYIRLDDGPHFTIRQQNARGQSSGFKVGDRAGVLIASDAAKVLRD